MARGGAAYLRADVFPEFDAQCEECAKSGRFCTRECRDHYVTNISDERMNPFAGVLKAMAFRKDDHKVNVSVGPGLLVDASVADNTLTACMAKTLGKQYLGRAFTDDEGDIVESLTRTFSGGGYKIRDLVKAIVTHPLYRNPQ